MVYRLFFAVLLCTASSTYAAPTVVTELTASWNETPLLMEAA